MPEKGIYRIVHGPAAGDFGAPIVRDASLHFRIQNGSSEPIAVSCTLTSIQKLEPLPNGMYKLNIEGKVSGQLFTAIYDPREHVGELTVM